MTNFLKDHPMGDGNTSFCKGSGVLNGSHNLASLENSLKDFSNSSQPLGTSANFRKFGSRPFQHSKLGLPENAASPISVDNTLPDLYNGQGPLPQPYGRMDNARMLMKYGKRKSKKRSGKKGKKRNGKKRSGKKRKSKKRSGKKSKSKKFGTTPGTQGWTTSQEISNNVSNVMNKQAIQGSYKQAVGYSPNNTQYYEGPILSNQKPNIIGGNNLPANYTNNQMNNPYFNFGSKKRAVTNIKPKLTSSKKRRFGSLDYGPNTVGYNEPMPIYNGGGNTVNFSTGKLFNPNIVGNINAVQPDGMTSKSWLTQNFSNKFGKNVYSPVSNGSGRKTFMQPEPDYMNKRLTANFGGSVITLNSSGKVTVTKN